MSITSDLKKDLVSRNFSGEIFTDKGTRTIYATDGSVYREFPEAVVFPKNKSDIITLIKYASQHKKSIIPRAAGTSLAGQVVGKGIVADISRHQNKILSLNQKEKSVRIEPGVVLEELNRYLAPHNLFFGPETSTANRCNIGGMVGNNACGLHSLVYGSTRDFTLKVEAILSDGSEVIFEDLSTEQLHKKLEQNDLEGEIYKKLDTILSNNQLKEDIREAYPDSRIPRRNTGYALDLLLNCAPYTDNGEKINLSKIIAGSEGTLVFITAITLQLIDLPPKNKLLVCVHLNNVIEATKANLIALRHQPMAIELMDKSILDLTKENLTQQKNRFFLKGDPGALLIVEFNDKNPETVSNRATAMEKEMRDAGYGYHFPHVSGENVAKVWALRKSGLGVLSNMVGDAKPVSLTEDTAVATELLPEYIKDFNILMDKYGLECTHHAHIATGELHLRPILNIKSKKDVELFHTVAFESAKLVKKYRGSLSGEHGDGRLRGEFIPLMYGEKVYNLLKEVKATFDPNNTLNPGKITDTPKMNEFLRYEIDRKEPEIDTIFDFSSTEGILRATEKCNGSGDCRKSFEAGGTLCPSFMATRDEHNSTRARANMLRETLTNNSKKNQFDDKELYKILDLCLLCKACKSECPSGVDIAKLKMEFLQHYYDAHHIPIRSLVIAWLPMLNKFAAPIPGIANFFMQNKITGHIMKSMLGFSTKRSMPLYGKQTLNRWKKSRKEISNSEKKRVYLFNDEFTNFNDPDIGIEAILLLEKLGYSVIIPNHNESGRTFLSKGVLRKAKKLAINNVEKLSKLISEESPLIGIEPSAILAFRDEYPDLVGEKLRGKSLEISKNALLFEEFICKEIEKGAITSEHFTSTKKEILLHGHCQQKAVASTQPTIKMLELPENYNVEEIPSGCCGMAGAFGYEKEHFELSNKIGEMVLFPAVRKAKSETIISAPGTSCRHQIKDGTGRKALHPISILFRALR